MSWCRLREQWRASHERRRWDHPHPSRQTERNAEIVRLRQAGLTHRELAEIYGISATRVRAILSGGRW